MDLNFLVELLEFKVKEGARELKIAKIGTEEYDNILKATLGTLTVLGNFHKVGIPFEDIASIYKERNVESEVKELKEKEKEIDINAMYGFIGKNYYKFMGE